MSAARTRTITFGKLSLAVNRTQGEKTRGMDQWGVNKKSRNDEHNYKPTKSIKEKQHRRTTNHVLLSMDDG